MRPIVYNFILYGGKIQKVKVLVSYLILLYLFQDTVSRPIRKAAAENPSLNDNWDDADGYYR